MISSNRRKVPCSLYDLSFLFVLSDSSNSSRKYVKQSSDDLLPSPVFNHDLSLPPIYPGVPCRMVTYIYAGFTRDIFVLKSRIPVLRIRSRPIAWFVVVFVVPSDSSCPPSRVFMRAGGQKRGGTCAGVMARISALDLEQGFSNGSGIVILWNFFAGFAKFGTV